MSTAPHLLTDLRLVLRDARLRPVYGVAATVERIRNVAPPKNVLDAGTISGAENLAQAIVLRLLTPRGELSDLAHPDYGSRLHELIGQPNSAARRDLVKLYVLESLAAEARIAEVVSVDVADVPAQPGRVDVVVVVRPAAGGDTVAIGPIELDLRP